MNQNQPLHVAETTAATAFYANVPSILLIVLGFLAFIAGCFLIRMVWTRLAAAGAAVDPAVLEHMRSRGSLRWRNIALELDGTMGLLVASGGLIAMTVGGTTYTPIAPATTRVTFNQPGRPTQQSIDPANDPTGTPGDYRYDSKQNWQSEQNLARGAASVIPAQAGPAPAANIPTYVSIAPAANTPTYVSIGQSSIPPDPDAMFAMCKEQARAWMRNGVQVIVAKYGSEDPRFIAAELDLARLEGNSKAIARLEARQRDALAESQPRPDVPPNGDGAKPQRTSLDGSKVADK